MTNLELGQMMFGNPTGEFETPRYADALIEALLCEMERVYWNINQKEWNRHDDPKLDGVKFRPYCWDEDSDETLLPNLTLDNLPQEIRWYKYPHRGQTCTINFNEKEWIEWFNIAFDVIRKNDTELY